MLSIIAQEKDYLVINKPAGILVHPPHANYSKPTVIDWVLEQYPEVGVEMGGGGDKELRPGIVHRLDGVVTGVMVIARTKEMFDSLKKQFFARKVQKEYTALLYGVIKRDEGDITVPLAKGKTRTLVKPRGSEDSKKGIKQAITHFEVLKRFFHYTLVQITLKTGRTHQIRAHFYAFGHSVVGDTKYCHPRYKKRTGFTKFIKSDRVFLHANHLGFFDLRGKWQEYSAPLPSDLQAFLEKIS